MDRWYASVTTGRHHRRAPSGGAGNGNIAPPKNWHGSGRSDTRPNVIVAPVPRQGRHPSWGLLVHEYQCLVFKLLIKFSSCCKRSPVLCARDIAKHKRAANITPSAATAAQRCLLHPPPLVDSGPDLSGPFFLSGSWWWAAGFAGPARRRSGEGLCRGERAGRGAAGQRGYARGLQGPIRLVPTAL